MTCTGQGARNAPPPLWPTPRFMYEQGPLVCPLTKHRSGSACSMPPPPPFAKRAQGWAATWETWCPLPSAPHLSPLCLPSPLCVQCGMRTGEYRGGGGHAKEDCMHPPPLAAWPPPVRTPIGAPSPPSAHRVCATPALCTNGECRAACKGMSHSPFRPSPFAPAQSNRTGRVQDPRTQTGHRNASVLHHPRFLRPMHASGAHEWGWLPLSHPHPHVHAENVTVGRP
jgi:hypothetical protein